MRALLAFDKFKDALSAEAACTHAAAALRAAQPGWSLDLCPLADGGEGFATILTRAAHGTLHRVSVAGPLGEPVDAAFGLVRWSDLPAPAQALLALPSAPAPDARVALVEMATASGLALLPPAQRDPWRTTTAGTGELILAAAAHGPCAIVVGLGGSATNDLGLGALCALGLTALTADGRPLAPPAPSRWAELAGLDGRVPAALPPLRLACDVTNPLLGPRGSAVVYGPQKGLRAADRPALELAATRLAGLLCAHAGVCPDFVDTPGAGAAGGLAFGLMAGAHARLCPGFDLVSAWLELEARLAAADLVLTGEGRFDASSLHGKGPGTLVRRARALGRPVHFFAGAIDLPASPAESGLALHALSPADWPLDRALRETPALLQAAVAAAFA